ncbi:helix-turn-helix domain-containing protein [Atopobiaceae bacterium 24-176]
MTTKELAEITGEHEGTIRRGILQGRIPADKINGRWVICRDAVFPNSMKALGLESGFGTGSVLQSMYVDHLDK